MTRCDQLLILSCDQVMESIEKIMAGMGAADIDSRLEEQLIDGILYAFQEQTTEVSSTEESFNWFHLIMVPSA